VAATLAVSVTTARAEEDTRMADPSAHPDPHDETGTPLDGGSTAGTPRWVKVFGAIALVVVVLFVVVLLIRGGEHGPGRHGGSSAHTTAGDIDPPAGVIHELP
jgi:hypothetical protein